VKITTHMSKKHKLTEAQLRFLQNCTGSGYPVPEGPPRYKWGHGQGRGLYWHRTCAILVREGLVERLYGLAKLTDAGRAVLTATKGGNK
jgi:hypothetical protein